VRSVVAPSFFALALAVALSAPAGCGARTGLPAWGIAVDASATDAGPDVGPDTGPDTGLDTGPDVLDAAELPEGAVPCAPGQFPLERYSVDMMLLVDRSGSMVYNIDGTSQTLPRKWDDLHDALAATLPAIQASVNIGAYAFPERFTGTVVHQCALSSTIDLSPGPNQAGDVLALFTNTDPSGGTPTAAAIQLVGDMLVPRISRTHTEVMVLATDGGPNCNGSLDASTCACTSPTPPACTVDNCLDDARTATIIASYASRGVPTYVIGLDSATQPFEKSALSEMATAGGRPNTAAGQPAYYSAEQVSQVNAAFAAITQSIARCALATPSRPSDPNAIEIQIDGVTVPKDASHRNGWDWNDPSYGQIALFGAACTKLASPSASAVAIVHSCSDAGF
jgi:hypothetical protein